MGSRRGKGGKRKQRVGKINGNCRIWRLKVYKAVKGKGNLGRKKEQQ